MVVFDEAHLLFHQLANVFKVDFHFKKYQLVPPGHDDNIWDWLEDEALPCLQRTFSTLSLKALEISDKLKSAHNLDEKAKIQKRCETVLIEKEHLENQVTNIKKALAANHDEWVPEIDIENKQLKITPIFPDNLAPTLLERIAKVRIYMSATFPGVQTSGLAWSRC